MAITILQTDEFIRTDTSDPYTGNVTIDSNCKGLVVYAAHGTASTDHVNGAVTIGGVTLNRLDSATDSAGEAGRVYVWFAQQMPSSGSQAFSFDLASGTGDDIVFYIRQYASSTGRRIVPIVKGTNVTADAANPSSAVDSGPWTAKRSGILYSGHDAVSSITAGSGMTLTADHDFGTFVAVLIDETSTSSGSTSVAVTATSEDAAMISIGVAEVSGLYAEACLDRSPGLMAPLSEPSGTAAFDFSGWCNTGTYVGSPTLAASSMLASGEGAGVDLNGTTQYVSFPDSSRYSLTTTNLLSLGLIVRPTSDGGAPFTKGGLSVWEYTIHRDTDDFFTQLLQNGGGSRDTATSGTANKPENIIYFLNVTMDDTGGDALILYVDAAAGPTVTGFAGTSTDTAELINIGRRGGGTDYWPGRAQFATIYPSVLSGSQITALKAAGDAVAPSSTLVVGGGFF